MWLIHEKDYDYTCIHGVTEDKNLVGGILELQSIWRDTSTIDRKHNLISNDSAFKLLFNVGDSHSYIDLRFVEVEELESVICMESLNRSVDLLHKQLSEKKSLLSNVDALQRKYRQNTLVLSRYYAVIRDDSKKFTCELKQYCFYDLNISGFLIGNKTEQLEDLYWKYSGGEITESQLGDIFV